MVRIPFGVGIAVCISVVVAVPVLGGAEGNHLAVDVAGADDDWLHLQVAVHMSRFSGAAFFPGLDASKI